MPKTLRQEGDLIIQLEDRNTTKKGIFRRLAREVSGDIYEVPEDSLVIFAYSSKYSNSQPVGEISFSLAEMHKNVPGTNFDSEYYPQISFLFIHRDFQNKGIGKLLIQECLKVVHKDQETQHKKECLKAEHNKQETLLKRPVRLQSAESAVGFFQHCGFRTVGEPAECGYSGGRCRLFRILVNMEETSCKP